MKQLPELKLGVNIDHIATLRQARGTAYPDPVAAALLAERAGADGITLHLREDRRHIQDEDVARMRAVLTTRMNLEMAATAEMVQFASHIRPAHCCIVPEKRAELTTEGGLDLLARMEHYRTICAQLGDAEIEVSLFIDPDVAQVEAAHAVGAPTIELHTGVYANALNAQVEKAELARLQSAIASARELGLKVNAGHGLNYDNIKPVAALAEVWELNIGHAIVAQAVFVGLTQAVKSMKKLMHEARQ